MTPETKTRLAAAVDALAADGTHADTLILSRETAGALGLHGTHVDLGSETHLHDAKRIAAELTHPDYDRLNGTGPGRPLDAETAAKIGAERCQAHLRRPGVVLTVSIDDKVPAGKFHVSGAKRHSQEA